MSDKYQWVIPNKKSSGPGCRLALREDHKCKSMTAKFENFNLTIGQIIAGRYRIESILGQGGMGVVLKVTDIPIGEDTIALKILNPDFLKESTAFNRFINEVKVARKLTHPNLIRLYDFGRDPSNHYYISMEYIDGTNLSKMIYSPTGNTLDFPQIIKILHEVASGMQHAHAMKVIHRDIKPDNILVGTGDKVVLTDLGLARALDSELKFTATGEAVGTPYYMAPETIQGLKTDERGDIYSFGIMAYEMASGKRPFYDQTWINLARMHLSQPLPELVGKAQQYPKWFHDFVKVCAEKKPEQRFQSFTEIADILETNLNEEGSKPRRTKTNRPEITPPPKQSRMMTYVAAFLGFVMAALIMAEALLVYQNNASN